MAAARLRSIRRIRIRAGYAAPDKAPLTNRSGGNGILLNRAGHGTEARVINLRLWRVVFATVPLAALIAMFSLRAPPEPLGNPIPPDSFDAAQTFSLAKQLARSAPAPRPGSRSDRALGELVQARFEALEGAEIAEQRFDARWDGDGVELRNVIGVLPGDSERQIALIAGRDTATGDGAATSIAATATLIELASAFSGATHSRTLVFVSSDGASIGAKGARVFVEDYSDAPQLDAVVVLSSPAARRPQGPHVVPWSTGSQSTAAQLEATAGDLVARETGFPPGNPSPASDFLRMSLPSGLGEQAPLVSSGLDAVRISSIGEGANPDSDGGASSLSGSRSSLDRFGRATQAVLLALDAAERPLEHGPSSYLRIAGSLLPAWAVALLALALLAPVGLVAGAGLASTASSPAEALRSLGWVAGRVTPYLAWLVALYALALIGVVPSPPFPFEPAAEAPGVVAWFGAAVMVAAFALTWRWQRPITQPPAACLRSAPGAALSLAALVPLLLLPWNPYAALLVALGLNFWLPAASARTRGIAAKAILVLLGFVPLLVVVVDLGYRLDSGWLTGWDVVFMVADGQIGLGVSLLMVLLAGCGTAIVALAAPLRTQRRSGPGIRVRRHLPSRPGGSASA